MKRLIINYVYRVLLISSLVLLTACSKGFIDRVKKEEFPKDKNYTYQQALENRPVCLTSKWFSYKDTRGRNIVEYKCVLNGYSQPNDKEQDEIIKRITFVHKQTEEKLLAVQESLIMDVKAENFKLNNQEGESIDKKQYFLKLRESLLLDSDERLNVKIQSEMKKFQVKNIYEKYVWLIKDSSEVVLLDTSIVHDYDGKQESVEHKTKKVMYAALKDNIRTYKEYFDFMAKNNAT